MRITNSGHIIHIPALRNAVLLCLVLLLVKSGTKAQDILYRGDPEPAGARGAGLGGALVSDIRDIEGLYNNPASLRALKFPGLSADHRHDWDQGIFFESLALRLFSGNSQSLGVGVRMTDAGNIGSKRLLGFTQYAADVGYAVDIFSNFSFGVLAGARLGKASGETKSGYSFSFGILYAPTEAVRYGIVVRDVGKSLDYTYSGLTGKTTLGTAKMGPATVEMGSTLLFPSRGRAPFLQLSISVERDYVVKELRYKGGIELTPWRFLAARIGYVNATAVQATGGLGLSIGNFRIDYAIMPRPQTSRYDEFSVKAFF